MSSFTKAFILQVLLDSSMATSFATMPISSPLRQRASPMVSTASKLLGRHTLVPRGGSSMGEGDSTVTPVPVVHPPAMMDEAPVAQPPPVTQPPPIVQSGETFDTATPEAGNKSAPLVSDAIHDSVSSVGPNAPAPGLLRSKFPNLPWHSVPNWLTVVRCLAIPALIAIFYAPRQHVLTSLLFAAASTTDYLDGYLARRWDVTSPFGAFLDPVADKLMVSTSLILLAGRYGARVAIPTSIILARELAVSALREWMASRGLRDVVQVGFQGKIKTALTMVALSFLLLVPPDGAGILGKLLGPSLAMLYLCTAITVSSGVVYFRAAAPALMQTGKSSV